MGGRTLPRIWDAPWDNTLGEGKTQRERPSKLRKPTRSSIGPYTGSTTDLNDRPRPPRLSRDISRCSQQHRMLAQPSWCSESVTGHFRFQGSLWTRLSGVGQADMYCTLLCIPWVSAQVLCARTAVQIYWCPGLPAVIRPGCLNHPTSSCLYHH